MAHAVIILILIIVDILFLAGCYSVNFLLGLVCTVALIGIDLVVFSVIGGIKLVQLLM
jgi:hypothetical protein